MKKMYFIWVIVGVAVLAQMPLSIFYAQQQDEEEIFIYDAKDLRNPFMPLFAPTPTVTSTPEPTATPTPEMPGQGREYLPTPTPVPYPDLVLDGIFWDPQDPLAIVNRRLMRQGDVIEEARIVRIDPKAVYLNFRGHPFKLERMEEVAIDLE
jgi:hypothetical protein